jgi:hypothetical protein
MAKLEIPRVFGKRDETTPFRPPRGSALTITQAGDPDARAEETKAINAPRIGLVLGVATIFAAPLVILDSLAGVLWTDDEGTLMAPFRSLLDGHRMYDDIYSLYGPLYNLVYALIYGVLRVPLTHDAGRLLFSALWLAYMAGFAAFVWKLTRSVPAALLSYAVVLLWLLPLSRSPGHPVQVCLLLLVAVLFLVSAIERASNPAAWAGLGAAIAGLALVKINIGAYVGGPVLYALLRASHANVWTRLAARLLAAALLFMPIAVEALLFDFDWVRTYCLFSTLVVLAALIVSTRPAKLASVCSTHWAAFVLAGALTCLAIVVGTMLEGSSAYAIFNAVVLQSAGWIRNWWQPLHLPSYGLAAAVGSVGTSLLWRFAATRPELQDHRELGLLVLRCAYVVAAAAGVALFNPMFVFSIVLPFSWVIMLAPAGVREASPVARRAAGLIASMMSLYAFPVEAFQQDAVATLLSVALAPVVARDALFELRRRGVVGHGNATVAIGVAVAAAMMLGAWPTFLVAQTFFRMAPLDLPGARLIRVDQQQADDLHWVTAQLSSCGASYSVPGMPSFAFWTGQPLPTTLNINDVLAFISPAQQAGVVQDLSRLPDLCIVYNPTILRRFDRGQIATDPPLLRYLRNDFVPKAERHGYIILVRRGDASKMDQPTGP